MGRLTHVHAVVAEPALSTMAGWPPLASTWQSASEANVALHSSAASASSCAAAIGTNKAAMSSGRMIQLELSALRSCYSYPWGASASTPPATARATLPGRQAIQLGRAEFWWPICTMGSW